ncbi:MAG: sugar transferase [Vicinamibacterales bacterium]
MAIFALVAVLVVMGPSGVPALGSILAVRVTLGTALLLVLGALMWPWLLAALGLYRLRELKHAGHELNRIGAACAVGSLYAAMVFAIVSEAFLSHALPAFWVAATISTGCGRAVIRRVWREAHRRRRVRQVIIVGTGPKGLQTYRALAMDPSCTVVGFVDKAETAKRHVPRPVRFLGTIDDLDHILASRTVDSVHIRLPVKSCYSEIEQVLSTCERIGVESCYDADIFAPSRTRPAIRSKAEELQVTRPAVTEDYGRWVKRATDIVGAVAGLIVFSPVMLAAAVVIRLTSRGPAFFVQERVGFRLQRLKLYKLRTMVADAEQQQAALEHQNEKDGPIFKIQNDPRITRVGRLLRRTSIDELPQLLNVLKGDMSLVGPRPMALRDVGLFPEASLMRRFCVKPGLTGLWQISGRSNTSFRRWIELDLEYIDRWSFALDLSILAKTVPVVLRGDGAA